MQLGRTNIYVSLVFKDETNRLTAVQQSMTGEHWHAERKPFTYVRPCSSLMQIDLAAMPPKRGRSVWFQSKAVELGHVGDAASKCPPNDSRYILRTCESETVLFCRKAP